MSVVIASPAIIAEINRFSKNIIFIVRHRKSPKTFLVKNPCIHMILLGKNKGNSVINYETPWFTTIIANRMECESHLPKGAVPPHIINTITDDTKHNINNVKTCRYLAHNFILRI